MPRCLGSFNHSCTGLSLASSLTTCASGLNPSWKTAAPLEESSIQPPCASQSSWRRQATASRSLSSFFGSVDAPSSSLEHRKERYTSFLLGRLKCPREFHDRMLECPSWAYNGACERHKSAMLHDCPYSCYCRDQETEENCLAWRDQEPSRCQFDKNMMTLCKRTCNFCTHQLAAA
mmetsp:Transcript_22634/g.51769  ORF Transcript_22634/g.51769 Transcript_22634/m.51769 type:complete len:176 (-) Transcript_22634:3-530(-)